MLVLNEFSVHEQATVGAVVDGIGITGWSGRPGWRGRLMLRTRRSGFRRSGSWAGLVDGRFGGNEARSFATLRMTSFERDGLARGSRVRGR